MNTLTTIRDNFREKYVWLLLPILFAICFIPSNRTGATNLYRLLIVLPMILCFRPSDLKLIWENTTVRWFLILCGWMTLTLAWDGLAYRDLKLFWRELNVLALFYLVFLVSQFHRERMPLIINSLLVTGFIGAMLIFYDWQGLQYIQTSWQHTESARGVFNHHLQVGWIMAVLSIVALHSWQQARTPAHSSLYLLALLFFAGVTFLVQARGGYIVFTVGVGLLMLLSPGKKTALLMMGGLLGLVLVFLLFQQEVFTIWDKILDRGTAGRLPIWKNGFEAINASVVTLLFGHGLSGNAENLAGNNTAAHYHNFFLNHGFYTGLVGISLYLGLLLSLLRKVIVQPPLWLWGVVLIAMQVGFITDGDRLLVNPSSTMLCVLLPMALIGFGVPARENKAVDWAEVMSLKHLGLFIVGGVFLVAVFLGLSRKVDESSQTEDFVFNNGDVLRGTVLRVPKSGALTVDIEGWPESFGGRVSVQVVGVQRPFPWRYKCEEAKILWRDGGKFLDGLTRKYPKVELKNPKQKKPGNLFRLEADVYINNERLAGKLVEAGFAVYQGDETPWCKEQLGE
ncbi:MAG: O-antigen ligase family protein [Porticoccus sp.]